MAKGLRLEGIREFYAKRGITRVECVIPDDFDDPLPEDFLITPLPDGA